MTAQELRMASEIIRALRERALPIAAQRTIAAMEQVARDLEAVANATD